METRNHHHGGSNVRRRDISTALVASAAGAAALLPRRAQSQTCSPPCYSQTAAETALGVTPTNTAYPPGHVYRYGTNTTPGTTDMTAAINVGANVCRQGNYTLQIPGDILLVSASLNFSGLNVLGLGSPFGGSGSITATSAQFDVITSTGLMTLTNLSVNGGWDNVSPGLSGDILSLKATAPAHPYVVTLINCSFAYAKKRAIYIERGGYTSFFHVHCLQAGLHALECFGLTTDPCTTIRDYGSSQFGGTPNGYGIKLTECASCAFHDSILEDTHGIQLNGTVNNEALTFDGVYQENTIGNAFFTDNAGGRGLTIRGCFGGNAACPPFALWQNVFYQGNSNLAEGPIPLANRIFSNSAGWSAVSATSDVTTGQLTLNPGTYRLSARAQVIINSGSGTITQLACTITNNASASGLSNSVSFFVEGADQTQSFGVNQDGSVSCFTVVQLTTMTTYYLRVHIALSGSISEGYVGFLRAELIE
jgi:hypothetical protein